MTRLTWSQPSDRYIETGLDHGVLYPKTGPAVPWNGLMSVDEGGQEGSAAYYIDGRPFLFLPKPKEFTATLKAFTYPDEFAAVMGVTEATPGMYLDSQQSDAFGLSYRTLIASGSQDMSAGYKIHLVYNATVDMQGITYQTLAGDISPVEFAWDIQAVPVAISGYRPTAHVIIDTRHMDEIKLHDLEVVLYGDENTTATMPDPQTIFDLLSYGDTIIITDNGDGTWTAEGSYGNIYMIGDGIFEIDNVNAVIYGDGTYDISSTP